MAIQCDKGASAHEKIEGVLKTATSWAAIVVGVPVGQIICFDTKLTTWLPILRNIAAPRVKLYTGFHCIVIVDYIKSRSSGSFPLRYTDRMESHTLLAPINNREKRRKTSQSHSLLYII